MTESQKAFLLYLGALFGFAHFLREFGLGNAEVLIALLVVVALTLRSLRRQVVDVQRRQGRARH
jgi:hypothetical protein